jgi:sugar lactone lactonase YvrE
MKDIKVDYTSEVFDGRACGLGECPVWHPERQELFWVDLPNNKLLSRGENGLSVWDFDELVSALAWIDQDRLLLANESTGLMEFEIATGDTKVLCPIEVDVPENRCNDGRADPWGGFWVGTMNKENKPKQGSIYRWYNGELRKLVPGLTIPNGICFDRSRNRAYYADTLLDTIYVLTLDPETGWPVGLPEVFLDLTESEARPDGAVTDAEGNIWYVLWGTNRLMCFSPEGEILHELDPGVPQPTCPGFGGEHYEDLFLTTAAIWLDTEGSNKPFGATLVFKGIVKGMPEPQVKVSKV